MQVNCFLIYNATVPWKSGADAFLLEQYEDTPEYLYFIINKKVKTLCK